MRGRTCAQLGILTAILVATPTHAAHAQSDVISIRQGTFTFAGGTGHLDISGNHGFHFSARTGTGVFELYDRCSVVAECPPGEVVSLRARWVGNDLPGSATLRGKIYEDVGGLNSDSSADAGFSGSVTMPPMADGPVSVTVPFEFAGRFAYNLNGAEPESVLLAGGGRATITLQPSPDHTSWEFVRADYEFTRLEDR